MDLVPLIFHERQEGQLCAQHALNALLQGPYFTAVDLSSLAQDLDREETAAMAEGGTDSNEYRRFLESGSSNYDDSGFFSVQVVSRALAVWGLDIRSIRSQEMAEARAHPSAQNAFICNLDQHWFTLRRFGGSSNRWYNLNSVLTRPQYVSETYLSMFISQLEIDGYSIFVVLGNIPPCEADELASEMPMPSADAVAAARAIQSTQPQPKSQDMLSGSIQQYPSSAASYIGTEMSEEENLSRAIAMSLGGPPTSTITPAAGTKPGVSLTQSNSYGDEEDVRMAIEASLVEEDKNNVALQKTLELSLVGTVASASYQPQTNNDNGMAAASTAKPPSAPKGHQDQEFKPESGPEKESTAVLSDLERMRLRRLERFEGSQSSKK